MTLWFASLPLARPLHPDIGLKLNLAERTSANSPIAEVGDSPSSSCRSGMGRTRRVVEVLGYGITSQPGKVGRHGIFVER